MRRALRPSTPGDFPVAESHKSAKGALWKVQQNFGNLTQSGSRMSKPIELKLPIPSKTLGT